MKKFLSLVLMAAMLLCALPLAATAEAPTVLTIGSVRSMTNNFFEYPVFKRICEELNITLDYTQYDGDTFSLMLTGGGLADIVVGDGQYITTIVNNKIAMNIYPLLDEYAPNIKSDAYLSTIRVMQNVLDLGEDELYMLAPWTGVENAGGAVQSNHCRLTLSWAVHEGMDCHLVLEERVKGSYNPEASGNNFLFQLLGVKSITVVPGGSNMMEAMEKVAAKLTAEGRKPYIVPGGASTPLGALGYVGCMEEIMHQMFEMGLNFDHMVVPSGSAGTHAGIIAGMIGNNINIPVTGIGVNRPKPVQENAVHTLANQTLDLLGVEARVPAEKVVAFDDYVGPGYSLPTDAMVEAVKMLAETEGILLDPVYSGKAMSGLIDLARKGYFAKGSKVLFLHTGGSPALYAYLPCFR